MAGNSNDSANANNYQYPKHINYSDEPCVNCKKDTHHLKKCTLVSPPDYKLRGCPSCNDMGHRYGDENCRDQFKDDVDCQWEFIVQFRNNTFPLDTPIPIEPLLRRNKQRNQGNSFGPWNHDECVVNADQVGRKAWGLDHQRPAWAQTHAHGTGRKERQSHRASNSNSSFPFTGASDSQFSDFSFSGVPNSNRGGPSSGGPYGQPQFVITKTNAKTADTTSLTVYNPQFSPEDFDMMSLVPGQNKNKRKIDVSGSEMQQASKKQQMQIEQLQNKVSKEKIKVEKLEKENQALVAKLELLRTMSQLNANQTLTSLTLRKSMDNATFKKLSSAIDEAHASNANPKQSLFHQEASDELKTLFTPVLEPLALVMPDNCMRCNKPLKGHNPQQCVCFCGASASSHVANEPCSEACFCEEGTWHTIAQHFTLCLHKHPANSMPHVAAVCDLCHCCGAKHPTEVCPYMINSPKQATCICGGGHLFGHCRMMCPNSDCGDMGCLQHCFYCGRSTELHHDSVQCEFVTRDNGTRFFTCWRCSEKYESGMPCSCSTADGVSKQKAIFNSAYNPGNDHMDLDK